MKNFLFMKEHNRVLMLPLSDVLCEKIMQQLNISGDGRDRLPEGYVGKNEETGCEIIGVNDNEHSFIFIRDRDYFRRINFDCIQWIEASGSYSCIHLREASKIMLSFNLSELSVHLPERLFLRVHRSYIVNIHQVDSFIGNMLCIGKERIPISKQHKSSVIKHLHVLGNVK